MTGLEQHSEGCCPPHRPKHAHGRPTRPARGAGDVSDIVDIPGGRAYLGTDRPVLPVDGESPFRQTRIRPYRIDAHTVTNARFERFVAETGYVTEAELIGTSFVFEHHLAEDAPPTRAVVGVPWWRLVEGADWRRINGPGSEAAWHPDHPVVQVTWNDAVAFAKWAGGRLPTEAEWEHAARGGRGDVAFPWGDRPPNDTDYFPCNIWQGAFPNVNLKRDGYDATAPVDAFAPNDYGLYNMAGNVWEWTAQPFRVRSLKKSVQSAHAGKAGYKILKGGSFLCHVSYCFRYRIAARTGNSVDSSTPHQGFRLVYDAKPEAKW